MSYSNIYNTYNGYTYYFAYKDCFTGLIVINPNTFILNIIEDNKIKVIGQFISSLSFQSVLDNYNYYNFYILKVPNELQYSKLNNIFNDFKKTFDEIWLQQFDIYIKSYKLYNIEVERKILEHIENEQQNNKNFDKRIYIENLETTTNPYINSTLSLFTNLKYKKLENTIKKQLIISNPVFQFNF